MTNILNIQVRAYNVINFHEKPDDCRKVLPVTRSTHGELKEFPWRRKNGGWGDCSRVYSYTGKRNVTKKQESEMLPKTGFGERI
jgi:hypothetical protein